MSGLLLLADVGVTLVWREPVTALLAVRSQDGLEREWTAESRRFHGWRRDDRTAAWSSPARRTRCGAPAQEAGVRADHAANAGPVLHRRGGDGRRDAALGPGPLCGDRVARDAPDSGDRRPSHHIPRTPFADIDELRRGQPIVLAMPYGRSTYRVGETRIVDPTEISVTVRGHDRLVLTSCHPPLDAAQRIVVFARSTAGGG
jgi:sortase A